MILGACPALHGVASFSA